MLFTIIRKPLLFLILGLFSLSFCFSKGKSTEQTIISNVSLRENDALGRIPIPDSLLSYLAMIYNKGDSANFRELLSPRKIVDGILLGPNMLCPLAETNIISSFSIPFDSVMATVLITNTNDSLIAIMLNLNLSRGNYILSGFPEKSTFPILKYSTYLAITTIGSERTIKKLRGYSFIKWRNF